MQHVTLNFSPILRYDCDKTDSILPLERFQADLELCFAKDFLPSLFSLIYRRGDGDLDMSTSPSGVELPPDIR